MVTEFVTVPCNQAVSWKIKFSVLSKLLVLPLVLMGICHVLTWQQNKIQQSCHFSFFFFFFSPVTREFNKTTTGRLNNGVPQVPPRRGESELNQFRQTLPVFHMRQEIMATINSHQVALVAGETGSGKTTQVITAVLLPLSLWNRLCTLLRRVAFWKLLRSTAVTFQRGHFCCFSKLLL